MIRAAIFDMDGLLVDSEPLWRQAETKVFRDLGVPITTKSAAETTGLRTDQTVHYWYERYPWKDTTEAEVGSRIDQTVLELIRRLAIPKVGVHEAITACRELDLAIALASSSSPDIITGVVTKLGLEHEFRATHSAEAEVYGKPNPAVYLDTAKKLGLAPEVCVALEDSLNGVISAKSAGMYCIAVPDASERDHPQFSIADRVVDSLLEVTPALIRSLTR